ncbi:hypothetical protein [Flavobacterium tibetense]|jgi:hypothetical protein|uniref:Uncharacterized protein n=1 Tax=Flavobacterium tibetense TaxID=2233533 RepID=A0A365P512_9FLAO|nr:hypothetical protein [Flavobacterium tibetense]RBA29701.1 hypothetical protein DPN68_00275 [Flavobacterium tibetense]
MNSKFILPYLLFTIVFVSCKKEKTDNQIESEEKSKTFDVTLNMVVSQDDNFQIFYIDGSNQDFDENKSLWVSVKGSLEPQDIIFNLPEDVIPSNIRLDLGNNENQSAMKLNSFKMSYYDKSYELKDTLILRNFVIGEQLNYDKTTSTLTPNKGKATIYDPLLYPQSNLREEIEKIVK